MTAGTRLRAWGAITSVCLTALACGDDDSGGGGYPYAVAGSGGTSATDSGSPTPICAPGQLQSCTGPGGCIGSRECAPDGLSWQDCECVDAGAGGTGGAPAGGSGSTGGGTGGGTGGVPVGGTGGVPAGGTGGSPVGGTGGTTMVCTPGTIETCLGPDNCSGLHTCLPDGSGYGPCDCGVGGGTGCSLEPLAGTNQCTDCIIENCCTEYDACTGDCASEFSCIQSCTAAIFEEYGVVTEFDLENCAVDCGALGGFLTIEATVLFDCLLFVHPECSSPCFGLEPG